MPDANAERIASLPPSQRALLEQRLSALSATVALAAPAPTIPRRPASIDTAAPLSFAQERIWFLERLAPGVAFNTMRSFRLSGPLDAAALERALDAVIARHEALRTAFPADDGQPVQVVLPACHIALPLADLSAAPEASRCARVVDLARELAAPPFDLARGPLPRAMLARLAPDEHVLLIAVHHIVFDGWSQGVLLRELAASYAAQAVASGAAPASTPLVPLPVQYADYAAWQRATLTNDALADDLEYWTALLRDVPADISLPLDRARPALQSGRAQAYRHTLPPALLTGVKALSRECDATIYMTLLAAWQILLGRLSNQDRFVIGTPVAGRTLPETEPLIGCFINTLASLADLSGNPTVAALVARVRRRTLEALAHQRLPFERLIWALRPERQLGTMPFGHLLFQLRNLPAWQEEQVAAGVLFAPYATEAGSALCDLSLDIVEQPDGLACVWTYATDVYDADTIARWAHCFENIVRGMVAAPETPVSRVPLLDAKERERILTAWNATARAYPASASICDLFTEQVVRTPEAIALVFADQRITYAELNRQAERLAGALRALGVTRETPVGLCAERSPEMIVGLLGILRAGSAYVPLDQAHPHARLAFILEDAGIPVLVTQRPLLDALPEHAAHVLLLDEPASWPAGAEGGMTAEPDDLAYVIYTSGSTGVPKGVAVAHRSVCNLIAQQRDELGVGLGSRVLQFASLSFDASVWEIFIALLTGAELHLADRDGLRPGSDILRTLRERAITTALLPPSLLAVLPEDNLPALRVLLTGGEACPASLARRWGAGRRFFNSYGPTEATVYATIAEYDAAAHYPATMSMGRPIANSTAYVLDAALEPVPVGVAGELYLGGVAVARGYLHRPALTAELFLPDPFASTPGARLYRSGDRARLLPDGGIVFEGRVDRQVKLRGYRIELGEIEAALTAHPAVGAALAVVRDEAPVGPMLVAYVAPRPGMPAESLDSETLRAALRERLPGYMVPAAIVPLAALPITANNKVDAAALPVLGVDVLQDVPVEPCDRVGNATTTPETARQTACEWQLSAEWEAILGISPIGPHDDFFALGGHSLLGVRLAARIERITGRRIPLSLLFQAPTLAEQARWLREHEWDLPAPTVVALQTSGSRHPLFCIHGLNGGVVGFTELARRIGSEQPLYGLQARGLDDEAPPLTSIAAMADEYLRAIRAIQPEGPYFLYGHCAGGVIAFEIARRLLTEGQQIGLLAVLDGSPGKAPHGLAALCRPRNLLQLVRDLPYWVWDDVCHRSPAQHRAALRFRMRQLGRLSRWGQARAISGPDAAGCSMPQSLDAVRALIGQDDISVYPSQLVAFWEAFAAALASYTPAPYPGSLTLLRARGQRLLSAHDPTKGWAAVARGGVEVLRVPGSHETMLREPHLSTLASILSARLTLASAIPPARGRSS